MHGEPTTGDPKDAPRGSADARAEAPTERKASAYETVLADAEAEAASWREPDDPPESLARAHRRALRAAFYLGRSEAARRHAFEGLRVAYERLDSAARREAHNDLAVVFGAQALFSEALEQLWRVVHLCEEEGLPTPGSVLNNLGNVYLEQRRHDDAITLFQRAVERFQEEGDEAFVALATANVGRTQVLAGRPAIGIPSLDSALDTFERLGRTDDVAATHAKLGYAHGVAGARSRARRAFERAVGMLEQGHGRGFSHEIRLWFGVWALDEGDVPTALEQLRAAADGVDLEMRGRIGVLEPLSRALEADGRLEEALDALRRHVRAHDAIRRDRAEAATRARLLELEHGVGGDQEVARTHAAELERRNLALSEKAARLERLSQVDDLTGLRNRRDLDARLREEIARAERHGRPLVLALLDLDDFKEVNDRFGHALGDRVLSEAGAILRQAVRGTDLAARWGGEEFALLLPDTTLTDAHRLIERVRALVAGHDWERSAPGLVVTVSAGAAELGERGQDEELLEVADRRMYAAKRSGRNRTVITG